MTDAAIPAIETLGKSVLSLHDAVPAEQWSAPSACPGWTVHDVLIHLTCTLREVVEPETLPAPVPGIERTNDVQVAAFRSDTVEESFAEYERLLPAALTALAALQDPADSAVVDFDDAGRYPAHLVADSIAFDHFCHLRHDLAAPYGPFDGLTVDATEDVLTPSMTWLIAGLPQMSGGALLRELERPVRLRLDGPGVGTWTLHRTLSGTAAVTEGSLCDNPATIVSTTDDFVRWGTRRDPEQRSAERVDVLGDVELGTRVRRAIHVF